MKKEPTKEQSKAELDTILSDEELHRCIEVAAYYISQNCDASKSDLENWLAAEREIKQARPEATDKVPARPQGATGNATNSAIADSIKRN